MYNSNLFTSLTSKSKIIFLISGIIFLFYSAPAQKLINTTGTTVTDNKYIIEYSVGEISITTLTVPANANYITQGLLQPNIKIINPACAVVIMAMDANGNVSSRDASTLSGGGGWLLTGNSGTTAANFLGTTDNQRINFRTNNITRMYLDQSIPAFGADIGHLSLSGETDVATRPAQLSIFGRDIAGASMPALFVSYVGGATWGIAGGNTSGRFFRLSQMATTFVQSHFYDVGMSQDSSLYIGNHGFQNVGGVFAKKMFTISAQDMVGINLDMAEKPKSRLHVKNGDVYLDQIGSGVIMKSPDGNCWRMTVSNAGTPVFTAITCP